MNVPLLNLCTSGYADERLFPRVDFHPLNSMQVPREMRVRPMGAATLQKSNRVRVTNDSDAAKDIPAVPTLGIAALPESFVPDK